MFTLDTDALIQAWRDVINSGEAHASVRFGDASSVILAHEKILTMEFVRTQYGWINDPKYCGLTLPNPEAREMILDCLLKADFVGFLKQPQWVFRPLFDMVAHFYKITPKNTFYAFDNNTISKREDFYKIFKDDKVLLCGVKAELYKEVLERRYGWTNIIGTVTCPNWEYASTAMTQMEALYERDQYRVAIVCAGAPGKLLTIKAKELGAVGIDFGSGADTAIQSDQAGVNAWEYDGPILY